MTFKRAYLASRSKLQSICTAVSFTTHIWSLIVWCGTPLVWALSTGQSTESVSKWYTFSYKAARSTQFNKVTIPTQIRRKKLTLAFWWVVLSELCLCSLSFLFYLTSLSEARTTHQDLTKKSVPTHCLAKKVVETWLKSLPCHKMQTPQLKHQWLSEKPRRVMRILQRNKQQVGPWLVHHPCSQSPHWSLITTEIWSGNEI